MYGDREVFQNSISNMRNDIMTNQWEQVQYDTKHSGKVAYNSSNPKEMIWETILNSGGSPFWGSGITIDNTGNLYTFTSGSTGGLFKLDSNGNIICNRPYNSSQLDTTPVLSPDGNTIYVTHYDMNEGSSILRAFNTDCTEKWGLPLSAYGSSMPVVKSDGTIYIADGTLKHLDANGDLIWEYNPSPVELDIATPALGNDGTIYTSSNTYDNLYAVNPDGTEKWIVDLPGNGLFSFSIDKNDNIYFGDINSSGARYSKLRKIDNNGNIVWTIDLGTWEWVQGAPSYDSNDNIYFGTSYGPFYSFTPDGELRWKREVDNNDEWFWGFYSSPIVDNNDVIYAMEDGGDIHAFDTNGNIIWETYEGYNYGGNGNVSYGYHILSMSSDGTFYVVRDYYTLAGIKKLSAWNMASGDVCIKSNPPGASITIDGTLYQKITALSETSCTIDNTVNLTPGNHSYEINLTGYQPKSDNFSIIAGMLTQIEAGDLILIPTDICTWIISLGGLTAITAYDIMLLVDAYLELTNFGFTVRMQDVNGAIAYYLNMLDSGNSFTGCSFT